MTPESLLVSLVFALLIWINYKHHERRQGMSPEERAKDDAEIDEDRMMW